MIYQHCLESMNLVWRGDTARDNAFVLSELWRMVRVPKQLRQTICQAVWSSQIATAQSICTPPVVAIGWCAGRATCARLIRRGAGHLMQNSYL